MCKKGTILIVRPLRLPFRAIQPNPSYDMLLLSSQRSCMPKMKNVAEALLRLALPLLKVDADADDGQVSI